MWESEKEWKTELETKAKPEVKELWKTRKCGQYKKSW